METEKYPSVENHHEHGTDHSPAVSLPVQPAERLAILDILRGFAILGILIINIQFYGRPLVTIFDFTEANLSKLDVLFQMMTFLFVSEKFFSILSILFGIGAGIMFSRAKTRKKRIGFVYCRRLIGLFIIGITHALLLYAGDFMGNYAILGIFLLLFRYLKKKLLLICSLIVLLVPAYRMIPDLISPNPTRSAEQSAQDREEVEKRRQVIMDRYVQRSIETYGNGSISQIFKSRAGDIRFQYRSLRFTGWKILSMLLLGLWCWKRGIVKNYMQYLEFFKKVMWISLIVGLAGSGLSLYEYSTAAMASPGLRLIFFLGQQIGAPALGIFYMTGIVLLFSKGVGLRIMRLFGPVGRTAMSNYVFQSLISTTLFYSYGLGLYYKTRVSMNILLAIGIFFVQIILSHLWLKKFNFGPLEWVLRWFAYLKKTAMRTSG